MTLATKGVLVFAGDAETGSSAHAYLCDPHTEACLERCEGKADTMVSALPITRYKNLECEVCEPAARHRNQIKRSRQRPRR